MTQLPHAARPAATPANAPPIEPLVDLLVASYRSDPRTAHLDSTFLPSRARTIMIIETLRRILFPGFFDDVRLGSDTIKYHVGDLLGRARNQIYEQVREALRYDQNRTEGKGAGDACEHCDGRAMEVTHQFLDRLPELRRLLSLDVQAAFDGDPAAASTDETIFCYPGVDAIFIHRIAHEFYKLKVPLLPRIMSEYSHNENGIDIHPGAQIGESFFIDHGTGVVIGETTLIGNRVKLHQGVTLGAVSTSHGQKWRGLKRHPTIEDDVIIYSGAIILGGETVIGKRCTIGGSVFVMKSVPPGHTVKMNQPEPTISASSKAQRALAKDGAATPPDIGEFNI
jgi:serine O-acetyltransferase